MTDAQTRRALSLAEAELLIEITETQPDRFGMTGPERAMLYRVALGTGFRVSE